MNSKSFNNSHVKSGAFTVVASLVVVAGLLILPVVALHRRGLDLRWAGAYGLVIGALTYWAYARDKRRAQEGEWRISEASCTSGNYSAAGLAPGSRSGGFDTNVPKAATNLCSG